MIETSQLALGFNAPPPSSDALLDTLERVWGYPTFRPGQEAAVRAFDAGRDVQLLLPTGGGKSLCYQVPAVARQERDQGPTLVVSPLIALMDDQVAALADRGVEALALHSAMTWDEIKAARQRARSAALIYASPERVKSVRFRRWLSNLGIGAVAVDEAHCVAEWGHDFRPDYLELGVLKAELGVPILAATATATPRVMDEIGERLGLVDPVRVIGGFERENLSFSVEHIRGDAARVARLIQLIREVPEGRILVYGATRKRVTAVAKALRRVGLSAVHYHAGRTSGARETAQSAFRDGRKRILIGTSAFGMGIDLPDVRLVVHIQAPGTLSAYYQEAGRAGRDGAPARCVLLYSPADSVVQARLRGTKPHPGVEEGWKALADYLYSQRCRQIDLVRHFLGPVDVAPCGRCDSCATPSEVAQVVESERAELRARRAAREQKTRKALAVRLTEAQDDTIIAFVAALRKPLGKKIVAQGLRGSRAKAALRKGVAKNPQYGALREVPELAVLAALDRLLSEGRLAPRGKKYPTLWIPDKRVRAATSQRKKTAAPTNPLTTALRSFRRREARRRRVKPYQVFPDAVIEGLVRNRPQTAADLLSLDGIGPTRLRRYGDALLELVRLHG